MSGWVGREHVLDAATDVAKRRCAVDLDGLTRGVLDVEPRRRMSLALRQRGAEAEAPRAALRIDGGQLLGRRLDRGRRRRGVRPRLRLDDEDGRRCGDGRCNGHGHRCEPHERPRGRVLRAGTRVRCGDDRRCHALGCGV